MVSYTRVKEPLVSNKWKWVQRSGGCNRSNKGWGLSKLSNNKITKLETFMYIMTKFIRNLTYSQELEGPEELEWENDLFSLFLSFLPLLLES